MEIKDVVAPLTSKKLNAALKNIDRPGTFCADGNVPATLPGLEVQGMGSISLPLSAGQAKSLKKRCEQAPFGKGEKTLLDTGVRRVWRLKPDQFSLANPLWETGVGEMLAAVQNELGLEKQKLEAHLYELLLYETGSFFLPHRDGEKLDRMVATLVVTLPSEYEGGELVVRFDGEEKTFDFAADSRFRTHFAAFYADCEHEVKPLRSGHRLSLIYNLTLEKTKKAFVVPRRSEQVEQIAKVFAEWSQQGEEGPIKLAVTLDHEYTKGGLLWDALKGVDRAKATILTQAAVKADCLVYLVLLTYWQSGQAEFDDYEYGYGSRWGRRWRGAESDSGHTMQEVYDDSLEAEKWLDSAGKAAPFGSIPVLPEEVVPPESLMAVEPEEEYEGYTGNAGSTLERWYRHAAIVIWPIANRLEVLCQVGSRKALPMLADMIRSMRTAAGDAKAAMESECREFARIIIDLWPTVQHARRYGEEADPTDPLPALRKLGDPELIRVYVSSILIKDVSVRGANVFAKAINEHGWNTFRKELLGVFAATSLETLDRNSLLLEDLCLTAATVKKAEQPIARETCRLSAEKFVARLKELDEASAKDWRSSEISRATLLQVVTRALAAMEFDDLLLQFVEHVQRSSGLYPLRTVQLPTLTKLMPWLKQNVKHPSAGLAGWIAACQQQLAELTAAIPQPPADFRREADMTCKCADCGALRRFLLDPTAPAHGFQMAMARRSHLEQIIRGAKCDVDFKTQKTGGTHTLACTKNTASYERRLKEYDENLKFLADLESLENKLPH